MQADHKKITRLLKTARGQVEGVLKMVEEDRYCIDIVNQLLAAQAVLRRAHCEVLRAHLGHCVAGAFGSGGKEARQKAAEMVDIIDKISK
ncbi:metal-sensing transcriptional repressor [Candidatus Avelusimicrobium aviculae]|uniref:metal-sensing transcriptional repressor n=1 Tax=Candidatus Avelusimicrobium aviculae TaxID=3416206 RepID=UPI003D12C19C